jgi:hypothetical protein
MYKRFNRKQKTRKKRKREQINPFKSIHRNQSDYSTFWSHYRWDPYTYWPGRKSRGMLPLRNFSTRRGIIPGQKINV